jgi:uncharacterized protein YggU (UPF0235/DUF167 family)
MPASMPSQRPDSAETLITVRVIPNAKQSRVEVDGLGMITIRVNARPVDGAATAAAQRALANALGLPQSAVQLVRGATSRKKTFAVHGLLAAEIAIRLAEDRA